MNKRTKLTVKYVASTKLAAKEKIPKGNAILVVPNETGWWIIARHWNLKNKLVNRLPGVGCQMAFNMQATMVSITTNTKSRQSLQKMLEEAGYEPKFVFLNRWPKELL